MVVVLTASACASASAKPAAGVSPPRPAATSVAHVSPAATVPTPTACSAAAQKLLGEYGDTHTSYQVNTTAIVADRWFTTLDGPKGSAPDDHWQSLPPSTPVEICLGIGGYENLVRSGPPGSTQSETGYVALTVVDGAATLLFAGPSYAEMAAFPLPGVAHADLPSFPPPTPAASATP